MSVALAQCAERFSQPGTADDPYSSASHGCPLHKVHTPARSVDSWPGEVNPALGQQENEGHFVFPLTAVDLLQAPEAGDSYV